MEEGAIPGSFRDPSGHLFVRDGILYRQVNRVYRDDYDKLIGSGLYEALVKEGLLVAHREHAPEFAAAEAYKILEPEVVPFVSYPYEWSFSQMRDAALVTLRVQREALARGMSLKDSSAYNVQFRGSRPVWIDTLSFETYREGRPWVAYRQFCQHFLGPLALMSRRDARLGQLLRVFTDGVPLEVASTLLPWRTRFSLALASHIHLHARVERRYAGRPAAAAANSRSLSRRALEGILGSLESAVRGLRWEPRGTLWGDYYEDTNYSPAAFEHKKQIVAEFLEALRPATVWDLGANVGHFSRLAAARGAYTVAFDLDPAAVEKNYRTAREHGETRLLPLVLDLANPSGGVGWANRERMSLAERGPADVVLALALVHHLAIGNNLPFGHIAEFLAQAGRALVIEFVPKSDSQVGRLLAAREDVFPGYTQEAFEEAFARFFAIEQAIRVRESQRTLYRMRGKGRG